MWISEKHVTTETDLPEQTSSKWKFISADRGKNLRTIWTELAQDYPEVFNLCSAQSLWFTSEKYEMDQRRTMEQTVRRDIDQDPQGRQTRRTHHPRI